MKDLIVSKVRPDLAIKCIYFAFAYVAIFEAMEALKIGKGADFDLLGLLLAQPLAWVTSRGFEKVKGAAGDQSI